MVPEAADVIVQISSIAVAKAKTAEYLDRLHRDAIPAYETAQGIVSIQLLCRSLVAYDELLTISVWESEEALMRFRETRLVTDEPSDLRGIESVPRTYELVMLRKPDGVR